MRVTVCTLPEDPDAWGSAWDHLVEHVGAGGSDLVVLPELPACPWFAVGGFDAKVWDEAVEAHEALAKRIPDLAPAAAVWTRPLQEGDQRFNEAVAWTPDGEGTLRPLHRKVLMPDEPGWRETAWFHPGDGFRVHEVAGARVGVQVCTDVMFPEHARALGGEGAHLVAVPRAAEAAPRWEVAVRMAAVSSGAYVASSNHMGPMHRDPRFTFGGPGLVADPEGRVVARTTPKVPFATAEVDLGFAMDAKRTYPRYVEER